MRRPGREPKEPQGYGQMTSYFIYVNVVSAGSPQTYEEALSGDDSRSWKEAMDREMNSLVKNKNLAISGETKR